MSTQDNTATGPFHVFGDAVAKQIHNMFEKAKKDNTTPFFVSTAHRDDLYSKYLAAFPEGSNPIHRKKTEHECNCCAGFIRHMGHMVIIDPQTLLMTSIWDVAIKDPIYQQVADTLANHVKNTGREIVAPFYSRESSYGKKETFEQLVNGGTFRWNHFYAAIPAKYMTRDIGKLTGTAVSEATVLTNSLHQISKEAIDTVKELIADNNLYRGTEHSRAIDGFSALRTVYFKLPEELRKAFVWLKSNNIDPAVSHIKNTSIGTLLTDLTTGMPVENCVARYESVVAPTNYKRPKSIVTPKMMEEAKKALTAANLLPSLVRRYAHASDIPVTNLLFSNTETFDPSKTELLDVLAADLSSKKTVSLRQVDSKATEMTYERFIAQVLPLTKKVDVLFSPSLRNNLVTMLT